MRCHSGVIVLSVAALILGGALLNRPVAASARDNSASREAQTEQISKGKRGRRLTRVDAWVAGLEGDKKRIYEKYGHPSGRYRQESMGAVVEKWVYSDQGKTFTFRGDKLVR